MATRKVTSGQGGIDVPGIVLREEPTVYLAAIAGPWLLQHSTPSWRAEDPEKGFQRIVKEERAKEIARNSRMPRSISRCSSRSALGDDQSPRGTWAA